MDLGDDLVVGKATVPGGAAPPEPPGGALAPPNPLQAPAEPPDPAKDLRLKFLEQAWQQHLTARQAFLRDLTIAAVAVVLLLVTFYRSVDLIERTANLEARKRLVADDQASISADFGVVSGAIASAVEEAETDLGELVENVPCAVEEHLHALETAIQNRRAPPPTAYQGPVLPDATPVARDWCAAAIGAPIPPDPLAALTEGELAQLVQADGADAIGYATVVDERVAQPLNQALASAKERAVDVPLSAATTDLAATVSRQIEALRTIGAVGETVGSLRTILLEVESTLASLEDTELVLMHPVARGGGVASPGMSDIEGQVEQMVTIISDAAGEIRAEMTRLQESLARIEVLMSQAAQERTGTEDSELAALEEEIDSIRENYARPLPGAVVLQPRDAVRFYPVILTIVFAYFAWRYLQLEQRNVELVRAGRDRGLDDDDLRVFLPGFRSAGAASPDRGGLVPSAVTGGIRVLLISLPGVLATISALAVAQSGSLTRDARWLYGVYGGAGVVLLGSYWLLVVNARRPRLVTDRPALAPSAAPTVTDRPPALPSHVPTRTSRARRARAGDRPFTFRIPLLAAVLVGLVSSVATLMGGVFNLFPALDAPSTIRGELSETMIEAGVTYAEFLTQTGEDRTAQSDPVVLIGAIASVTVEAEGLRGENLDLRWSMVDASTNKLLTAEWMVNQQGLIIIPEARSERLIARLWVPLPPRAGEYLVRLTLYQGSVILDSADSVPFIWPEPSATPDASS